MRKLVLLCALAPIAAPATAQTTLGLKGGVGFATVSIEDEAVVEESVSGIAAGVELGIPVSSAFSLRFGGSYAQKGGRGTIGGGTVTLDIDYLQFSALARVATPGDGLSVGLMAGPWLGYKRSCEVQGTFGEMIAVKSPCDDSNFSDFDIKTLDFGLAVGGGIELPLSGSLRLGLDSTLLARDRLGGRQRQQDPEPDRSGRLGLAHRLTDLEGLHGGGESDLRSGRDSGLGRSTVAVGSKYRCLLKPADPVASPGPPGRE